MPISFLKSTANNNGYAVRPSGYTFPAGLSGVSSPTVSLNFLIVAGGGGSRREAGGGAGTGGAVWMWFKYAF